MSSEPSASRLTGQTILVVDDQAQIRSLIRRTLEAHGAQILEAGNSSEALATFAQNHSRIALAIVDFLMPGVTGLDLAAQLGRDAPGLKILYMSSAIESIAMESLAQRSPELVLLKPFSLEDLLARVLAMMHHDAQ
jgi:CheY-like chemotaxis protein